MLFGFFFFFFNDTATTEIYTLSLHDALPICSVYDSAEQGLKPPMVQAEAAADADGSGDAGRRLQAHTRLQSLDRKSTRLNSSHLVISYAVFCLKKKKITYTATYSLVQR